MLYIADSRQEGLAVTLMTQKDYDLSTMESACPDALLIRLFDSRESDTLEM